MKVGSREGDGEMSRCEAFTEMLELIARVAGVLTTMPIVTAVGVPNGRRYVVEEEMTTAERALNDLP